MPVGNPNWTKGVSGNPGGRPQGAAAWCQNKFGKHGDKLWQAFYDLAFSSEDERVRLDAMRELANRGFGKPRETVALTGADGGPVTVVLELPAPKTNGHG